MTSIAAHAVLQETCRPSGKARLAPLDVAVPLEMRGLGTGPASATVSGFSRFGCRVQCRRPFHPGARINQTLPGLAAIDAHVVWYRKRDMGLKFDHPLHEAVADHLIRCYPAAPSTE